MNHEEFRNRAARRREAKMAEVARLAAAKPPMPPPGLPAISDGHLAIVQGIALQHGVHPTEVLGVVLTVIALTVGVFLATLAIEAGYIGF